MEIDDAAAAEQGRAPGDGAAVIAVGRGRDGDLARLIAEAAGEEVGGGRVGEAMALGEVLRMTASTA
jgi:hypothetical protein